MGTNIHFIMNKTLAVLALCAVAISALPNSIVPEEDFREAPAADLAELQETVAALTEKTEAIAAALHTKSALRKKTPKFLSTQSTQSHPNAICQYKQTLVPGEPANCGGTHTTWKNDDWGRHNRGTWDQHGDATKCLRRGVQGHDDYCNVQSIWRYCTDSNDPNTCVGGTCQFQQTAGNGNCGGRHDSWEDDNWGLEHSNSWTSANACLSRGVNGHDGYCGTESAWKWCDFSADSATVAQKHDGTCPEKQQTAGRKCHKEGFTNNQFAVSLSRCTNHCNSAQSSWHPQNTCATICQQSDYKTGNCCGCS